MPSTVIKRIAKHSIKLVNTREDILGLSLGTGLTLAKIGIDYLSALTVTELFRAVREKDNTEVLGAEIPVLAMAFLVGVTWYASYLATQVRELIVIPVGQRAGRRLTEDYVKSEMISPFKMYQEIVMSDRYTTYYRARFSTPLMIGHGMSQVIPTALNTIVASSIVTAKFGWAGLGLIPFVGIYAAFSAKTTNSVTQSRERAITANNIAFDSTERIFTNRETIDAFDTLSHELEEAYEKYAAMLKAEIHTASIIVKLSMYQSLISALGLIALLMYFTHSATEEDFTADEFVLLISYLTPFFAALTSLGPSINQFIVGAKDVDTALQAMERSNQVVDQHPDVYLICPPGSAKIKFRNIHFAYDQETPVLSDLSLTIKAGQKVCFVGPSGSGKSTITKLLERLYDLNDGSISINNQDITSVSLKSLRSCIGVIPQSPALFNLSLRYNLTYGCMDRVPPVTDDEVKSVLRAVKLEELFDRLDNVKFGDLSGGQKQRIAIARVILKKPAIVIGDEATSALDANTEKLVQETMDEAFKGATSIFITHRLQTAMNADVIFVLNKGRVVEQGTHAQLLSNRGLYAQLWQEQVNKKYTDSLAASHGSRSSRLFKYDDNHYLIRQKNSRRSKRERESVREAHAPRK